MTTEKTDSVLSVLDSIRMQATFYEFEGSAKARNINSLMAEETAPLRCHIQKGVQW